MDWHLRPSDKRKQISIYERSSSPPARFDGKSRIVGFKNARVEYSQTGAEFGNLWSCDVVTEGDRRIRTTEYFNRGTPKDVIHGCGMFFEKNGKLG